mmetsp:Transcript_38676/g.97395  ORF Transcript_38676/g.97395 Transcript_38676/m.97395 type:complete len:288 (+) Transcript_38676:1100-1963(+)
MVVVVVVERVMVVVMMMMRLMRIVQPFQIVVRMLLVVVVVVVITGCLLKRAGLLTWLCGHLLSAAPAPAPGVAAADDPRAAAVPCSFSCSFNLWISAWCCSRSFCSRRSHSVCMRWRTVSSAALIAAACWIFSLSRFSWYFFLRLARSRRACMRLRSLMMFFLTLSLSRRVSLKKFRCLYMSSAKRSHSSSSSGRIPSRRAFSSSRLLTRFGGRAMLLESWATVLRDFSSSAARAAALWDASSDMNGSSFRSSGSTSPTPTRPPPLPPPPPLLLPVRLLLTPPELLL